MGKKDKKKKKAKGAGKEKTEAKTQKRAEQKVKRETGEDIDAIMRGLKLADHETKAVVIEAATAEPPSPRTAATLTAHPSKDELLLFGGEYFNGKLTQCYNDLFTYQISRNQWRKMILPNSPSARSSHQMVALERGGGELWLYGGEFTTPTNTQFRTFRDLWCLHLTGENKQPYWEEVKAANAPPPRSGHRMLHHKRTLIIFGGFVDNGLGDIRYHNDLWSFDLDDRKWTQHTGGRNGPSARSAFQFFVSGKDNEEVAFLYGGYHTERARDIDSGTALQDMWALNLTNMTWSPVRITGTQPRVRTASALQIVRQRAYLFGGASDTYSQLDLESEHLNDMCYFNCGNRKWTLLQDGKENKEAQQEVSVSPRRSALLTSKGTTLYLFGGVVEDNKNAAECTRNDMYCMDVGRSTSSWRCLYAMETDGWVRESDEEEEDEEDPNDPRDQVSDEEYVLQEGEEFRTSSDEEDNTEAQPEEDAPQDSKDETTPAADESLSEFFNRTKEHWLEEISSQNPDATAKDIRRLAFGLARSRYQEVSED